MSAILDAVSKEIGPGGFAQIGERIGLAPEQTRGAVSAALPMLIGGLSKNANASEDGASSLFGALTRDHEPDLASAGGGGGLMGALGGMLGGGGGDSGGGGALGGLMGAAVSAMGSGGGGKQLDGAGILGHILGSKQGNVEQGVAKSSGLDVGTIAKLLPILAPIVMSALANLKKDKGLDAGGVAGLLKDEDEQISPEQGGLSRFFDSDNDGSMVDDVARLGGQLASSGMLSKLFG